MATCINIADAEYPARFNGHKIKPLAGESLLPVFKGEKRNERPIICEHLGNRAIRKGDWKLS